jgi:molybdopterin molybdotransferase
MLDHVDTTAPLTHFLRVTLSRAQDRVLDARLAGAQGSNLMRTLAVADALLIVPESTSIVEPDMMLEAIMLPDTAYSASVA